MANSSSGGQGPGKSPSIEPNPSPIAPLPSPETDEKLQEQFDDSPSLLDEPPIKAECQVDLEAVLKAINNPNTNQPRAAKMLQTAPDHFCYLYAQEWELLPDDEFRRWGAADAVERLIKERE